MWLKGSMSAGQSEHTLAVPGKSLACVAPWTGGARGGPSESDMTILMLGAEVPAIRVTRDVPRDSE